jgi:hypothetical protein
VKKKAQKSSRKAPEKKGVPSRERPKMTFVPFTFEQVTDADLHPPLVTMESKIAEFEETARRETELSAEDKADGKANEARNLEAMAEASRAKAAMWRKLSALPKAEATNLDFQICGLLNENVDFLLARIERGECESGFLRLVIVHAMKGLLALAPNGKASAATGLVDCLIEGVMRFECLALNRPELFTHYTRQGMANRLCPPG